LISFFAAKSSSGKQATLFWSFVIQQFSWPNAFRLQNLQIFLATSKRGTLEHFRKTMASIPRKWQVATNSEFLFFQQLNISFSSVSLAQQLALAEEELAKGTDANSADEQQQYESAAELFLANLVHILTQIPVK
jgi:hypothetical protein